MSVLSARRKQTGSAGPRASRVQLASPLHRVGLGQARPKEPSTSEIISQLSVDTWSSCLRACPGRAALGRPALCL